MNIDNAKYPNHKTRPNMKKVGFITSSCSVKKKIPIRADTEHTVPQIQSKYI